jgi:hypothetical protein
MNSEIEVPFKLAAYSIRRFCSGFSRASTRSILRAVLDGFLRERGILILYGVSPYKHKKQTLDRKGREARKGRRVEIRVIVEPKSMAYRYLVLSFPGRSFYV